ncbi:hypothetical protein PF010_g16449 [Phytophthora fragariae]|uniref:Uncharacterized protein n=1 Tax=Phytophthora fragariae TaxID=53985 RepID=A0A6A3F7E1_9STRA|nr:hypothetical protein PF009_g9895 [Phytophthora fragariae]KAE9083397.1 hypothetical protein PF007_g21915 [Phytophthora fragariae]KAE9096134.1 hypothetical protein PF010_g16449 [Phytophthora fragariae]KAE9104627.1 hypothetical protein PF006_g21856 [Phytophthora fragariae]KAE9187863.1 hypothetical protein PF004_g22671 [Phytophthora fragariae]
MACERPPRRRQAKTRLTALLPSELALLANALQTTSGDAQDVLDQDRVASALHSFIIPLQRLAELRSSKFVPTRVNDVVGKAMFGICPLLQKTVTQQRFGRTKVHFLDKSSEFVQFFLISN